MGLILPQTVKVRTSKRTCKYYREKGYTFKKWGDIIEVNVLDLPKKSHEMVKVICDICGKQFKRIESEMNKSSSHYCSIECRNAGMYWSEQDTQILVDNFGKLSYEEITRLVSDKWDIEAVRRKAISLGLTQSRAWSKDEIEIISKYHSNITMPELMDKLPKRTDSSISAGSGGR